MQLSGRLARAARALALGAVLFASIRVAAQDEPPEVTETITVTATRTETRLTDAPASLVVLSREAIDLTPAATVDDALRQVPGFTLFRRTGSRSANPTSQGVSLRGLGASGASRAVVLEDGIPLNDPFGGWVSWGRVPAAALDRIEVVRGGASELYGSAAMGGVVQFLRRTAGPMLNADVTGGSQGTGTASVSAFLVEGDWSGSLAADLFTTSGYIAVGAEERGPVDRPADSRHASFDLTLRRGSAFVRGSYYRELRNNGTELQTNDTLIHQLSAGADTMVGGGVLWGRAYASRQDYAQTFSAIAPDRASERLTVEQEVPARSRGGSLQWTRTLGGRHALVTGLDVRNVEGTSDELQYSPRGITQLRSGGQQLITGLFAEDVVTLSDRVSLTAGARFDGWRNYDAAINDTNLPSREAHAVSPRIAINVRAAEGLNVFASAYGGFRAPTLNELYRGFRVGNVVTQANDALGAEKVRGFEGGARWRSLRATAFWMQLEGTISNVTLSSTPALITRQRQNVGSSRSRGLELEGEWRLLSRVRVSGGYLFTDSVVTAGQLEGKRLPQVARHQATAQVAYLSPLMIAAQARWSSRQFDDDQNALPLRSYFVMDLLVAHPLRPGVEATLAAENLFDRRIEASATPVISYAQPRSIRAGIRIRR